MSYGQQTTAPAQGAPQTKKDNPDFGPRVTSGLCRIHHAHLVSPDESKYGQGKHKITGLFAKSACDGSQGDPLKPIKDACIAQAKRAFPNVPLDQIEMPIKDGDQKAKYAGFGGTWTITAKCKPKAQPDKNTGRINVPTYDANRQLTEGKEIYNGCYGRICVSPHSYTLEKELMVQRPDKTIEKQKIVVYGIRLQLQSVQKLKDGDRLGGGEGGSEFNDGQYESEPAPGGTDF